jgi:hypothetical protein
MRIEQNQNFEALQATLMTSIQPLLSHVEQTAMPWSQRDLRKQRNSKIGHSDFGPSSNMQNYSTICISASVTSEQCPRGCRCRCHIRSTLRTPVWLRCVFGQLLWTYNSSVSMKSCNYNPCRKSLGKHHFTYYFPSWLISRAVIASANCENLFNTGAKIMVNIPLIIPEENHILWSLVIAGNLNQLQQLLSHDKNLIYVRNQWGQSIMHVSSIRTLLKYGLRQVYYWNHNEKATSTNIECTHRLPQKYTNQLCLTS